VSLIFDGSVKYCGNTMDVKLKSLNDQTSRHPTDVEDACQTPCNCSSSWAGEPQCAGQVPSIPYAWHVHCAHGLQDENGRITPSDTPNAELQNFSPPHAECEEHSLPRLRGVVLSSPNEQVNVMLSRSTKTRIPVVEASLEAPPPSSRILGTTH
jgi:hypothetical protein